MLNKDKLSSIASTDLSTNTFKLLDTIQTMPKEVQTLSLASMFLLICERYEVDPRVMLENSDRRMRDITDKQYWRPEFRAIKEYLEKEL